MPPRKTSGTEISTASTFLKEKKKEPKWWMESGWIWSEFVVVYVFQEFLEFGEKTWSCQYTWVDWDVIPLHTYILYIYIIVAWYTKYMHDWVGKKLVVPAGGLENTPCPDTCYMFQRCTMSYKQKNRLYICQGRKTHQYSMYIHSISFYLCSLAI